MKSTFATEIDAPKARVAELYSNPDNNVKWMDDIKECEHISGRRGQPGSKYRFIPKKKGNMEFVATVVERNPSEYKLKMEASNVDVLVTGKFVALSPKKTKFISEEVFTFKGTLNKLFGFFARGAVKKAHTKHMRAFKKFAKTAKYTHGIPLKKSAAAS